LFVSISAFFWPKAVKNLCSIIQALWITEEACERNLGIFHWDRQMGWYA
jgi:hypothetical protein